MVNLIVFFVCAIICILGATGVVFSRNPVHSALSLVATLFGIAVLFVQMAAQFLAAVQVIVYTGAIVVLILFVIMLLGVDKEEDIDDEPLAGQRVSAYIVAGVTIVGLVVLLGLAGFNDANSNQRTGWGASTAALVTGDKSVTAPLSTSLATTRRGDVVENADPDNIKTLGRLLFTKYVFAFEVTGLLLTIAVVGAVVMARRPTDLVPQPDEPASMDDDFMADVEAESSGAH